MLRRCPCDALRPGPALPLWCLLADINTAFDLLHSGKCLRCVLTFDK